MKRAFLLLSVSLLLCVTFAGCGGKSGGSGADFDSTQYYTKNDVKQLFSDAGPWWINGSPIISDTNISYSTGTTLLDGSTPTSNMKFCMLVFTYTHTGSATGEWIAFDIGTSATDHEQVSFKDIHDGESRIFCGHGGYTSQTKLWSDGGAPLPAGSTLQLTGGYVFYDASK